ncbi:TPA: hypothetical protein IX578_001413 [Enterococcus faecium]|nr:hypothetical protein [Enterococcus faecium]HAQ5974268.1 hypothetical protein [Enterococcus faecium]HAQ6163104.1 hypothetical protein [Enterococcus faecium]HAQ6213376.1 hypothetical protein [Enterococcus faecium]HAQ6761302.1 hypothetical protein [Enterococcus faecium]
MQITIPDNLVVSELTTQITNAVLNSLDERLHLMNKSVELPPYPNKSEVKKVLGIGDDKLTHWISLDLKTQQWSKLDIRIERSELQRFLKENFEF